VCRIEDGSQEQIDEFYARWLNIFNIKDTKVKECACNIMKVEWQEIKAQRQKLHQQNTDMTIQHIQIPKRHNTYIGQQWKMPNGLKVLI